MKPLLLTKQAKEMYEKLKDIFVKKPEVLQVKPFAIKKEEPKKKQVKVAKLLTPDGLKK